jgi:hypothetical protein
MKATATGSPRPTWNDFLDPMTQKWRGLFDVNGKRPHPLLDFSELPCDIEYPERGK